MWALLRLSSLPVAVVTAYERGGPTSLYLSRFPFQRCWILNGDPLSWGKFWEWLCRSIIVVFLQLLSFDLSISLEITSSLDGSLEIFLGRLSWIGRPNSNSAGEGSLWSTGVALRQRSEMSGSDLVIFDFSRADFTDLTWLSINPLLRG